MRVLGISGSLRRDSHNTQLLRAAEQLLPPHATLELLPAENLKAVPPYDEDDEGRTPAAVAELRRRVEEADAVLVATPEYNASLPGSFKNALDWLSRPVATNPFRNKPVAVLGASTGLFGAIWAQEEGRKVLRSLGARVVGDAVPLPHAHEQFAPDGRLVDAAISAAVERVVTELLDEVVVRDTVAA